MMAFSLLPILVIAVVVIVVIVALAGGRSGDDGVPPELSDEDILREAREGRKIQAIKWYRSLYGVGLREAKQAVERMLDERR